MASSPGLLDRLTALRQRLGEMALPAERPGLGQHLRDLEQQLAALRQTNRQLEQQLAQLLGTEPHSPTQPGVRELSALPWRWRRLLLRARQQIEQLKPLTTHYARFVPPGPPHEFLQATIAFADFVLRSFDALAGVAESEEALGDGLEVGLAILERRHKQLAALGERCRRRHEQVENLARLLERVAQGQSVSLSEFEPLLDAVQAEQMPTQPLLWYTGTEMRQSRHAARQGLNAAVVLARVVTSERDWNQSEPPSGRQVLLAALLHDVGWLGIGDLSPEADEFTPDQRRLLEAHPTRGAELVAAAWPQETWLAEAIAAHHEFLDGTGYPRGLTSGRIPRLARWLLLAETYAACSQRNHRRQALSPRAALTEVLLEAERGKLDLNLGERLHHQLTATPAGTLVELSDGSLGLVRVPRTRPVVQVVAGADGCTPPGPELVDLALVPQRQIVRVFSLDEARHLLGTDQLELW
jgi:HD-GYP domain-containing protein (c-di-GMP phosphodiesterase class II)